MLRPAPRITRSAVRLLADSKPSWNLTLPNARPLCQYPIVHPSLVLRNPISAAPIPAPTLRLPTQGAVEGLQTRSFASTSRNSARHLRSDNRYGKATVNRPLVGMTDDDLPRKDRRANPFLPFQASSFVDALVTTIVGVGIIFTAGTAYMQWYKWKVLVKMEDAFEAGYDPALELAAHSANTRHRKEQEQDERERPDLELEIQDAEPWTEHLRRKEQDVIDPIVKGEEAGHYYVLLGPKGTGKTTMIFDAMAAIQAEGVAICDAHPDLEVFRLRLGKALNYEFHEDSQTSLFQRRDPREAGPALDIERALNKLEKVALRYSRKNDRPPVLIINNVHYFNNDDEGRDMLLQLQQRAEAWAASGILTMVFSTDDSWPFLAMRKNASRMHVVSVYDLDNKEAIQASMNMRRSSNYAKESIETVREAVSIVGGRLSYLSRVSKARDMLEMANHLRDVERGWLLSRIGLIEDCDDDVMDEQKWSSCSWLLLQAFVKRRRTQEDELRGKIEAGEADESEWDRMPLPAISYYECRQIMTRADFMEELDRLNIISIDINHNVHPDSFLILHAAQDVVEEEGFEEKLNSVRNRIDEIESLHRTRELTFKDVDKGDRIRLTVDKGGARLVEDS